MNKCFAAATLPLLLTLSACITPPANDDLPVPGMSLVSLGPTDLSVAGIGGNLAYVGQLEGLDKANFAGNTVSFSDDKLILTLESDGDLPGSLPLTFDEELGAYAAIWDDGSMMAYVFRDQDNPNALVVKVVFQTDMDDFTAYGVTSFAEAGSAFLPTVGSATYTGGLEATDHLGSIANGNIELLVNFLDQSISGGFSIEDGTVFGEASFSLGELQINSIEANWANFYSNIESTDTNIANSNFMASISGENSEFATGIFFLRNDSDEALAGAFTASQ
jgi:hypothetical protein